MADMTRPPKVSEWENPHVNLLLYGKSGVGKTYLATSAPSPVYVLNIDKGVLTLKDFDNIYAKKETLSTYKDILMEVKVLSDQLKQDPNFYRTIFVDNLTEMQRRLMLEAQNDQAPGISRIQDWGVLLNQMDRLVRIIRDLPCHTVFLAMEDTREDNGVTNYSPSLSGKMKTEIPNHFDLVGRMIAIPKTSNVNGKEETQVQRYIRFGLSEVEITKDRSSKLGTWERPNFGEITAKVLAPRQKPSPAK